jgi:hypothetical protein
MTLPTITVAVLLAASVAVLSGCSPTTDTSAEDSGIGAWPTFLPTPTDGGMAHGSAADPAMSYAGAPVVVDVDDKGTVTANLQGPTYPAGTKVGSVAVECTYRMVLSDASETVSLGTARFDVLDHEGAVHVLRPASGDPLSATVQPGQTVTLDLVATVPSGEGLLRYAPDGTHAAAAWDYVAETD